MGYLPHRTERDIRDNGIGRVLCISGHLWRAGKYWGCCQSLSAGAEHWDAERSVPAPTRHLCHQILQRLHLEQKGSGLIWRGHGPAQSLRQGGKDMHTARGGGFGTAPGCDTVTRGLGELPPIWLEAKGWPSPSSLFGPSCWSGQGLEPQPSASHCPTSSHRLLCQVAGTQVALAVQLKGLIQDL